MEIRGVEIPWWFFLVAILVLIFTVATVFVLLSKIVGA